MREAIGILFLLNGVMFVMFYLINDWQKETDKELIEFAKSIKKSEGKNDHYLHKFIQCLTPKQQELFRLLKRKDNLIDEINQIEEKRKEISCELKSTLFEVKLELSRKLKEIESEIEKLKEEIK